MIDGEQNHGFHHLCLDDGPLHLDNGLPRENRRPLRYGPDIALKLEMTKVVKKTGIEMTKFFQVSQILFTEMQIGKVFDQLLHSRHDGKATPLGNVTEEHIKDSGGIHHSLLEIGVRHGQFIKIRQHGQVDVLIPSVCHGLPPLWQKMRQFGLAPLIFIGPAVVSE